jgi:hypothetical protein
MTRTHIITEILRGERERETGEVEREEEKGAAHWRQVDRGHRSQGGRTPVASRGVREAR